MDLTLKFKKSWLSPTQKGAYCTASLIGKDLILTNYHCVPGKGNIAEALLTMGYLKPRTRRGVAQSASAAMASPRCLSDDP